MSRFFGKGRLIEVEWDKMGVPLHFKWEGKIHPVEEVIVRWRVDEGWWTGDRQFREYFRLVTTTDYMVEIYRDFANRLWRIQRVYD